MARLCGDAGCTNGGSPAGSALGTGAIGRSTVRDAPPTCVPRRLTKSEVGEHHPSWSPDGRYIAYVTWTEMEGGAVYRVRADGQGPPERMSRDTAYYQHPAYSPDGTRIVAE